MPQEEQIFLENILHGKRSGPRLARRLKTEGLNDKPYRTISLDPNPSFVSHRALRKCGCANRQSYQNVSRETFWYDPRAKSDKNLFRRFEGYSGAVITPPLPFIEMQRHRRAARLPSLFIDHPGKLRCW
ncbi:MAG: hypothetical protein M3Z96_12070 [Pseudomonadota bacterium]|nr:hypothetical protein [Pseudomonadota bacterium]